MATLGMKMGGCALDCRLICACDHLSTRRSMPGTMIDSKGHYKAVVISFAWHIDFHLRTMEAMHVTDGEPPSCLDLRDIGPSLGCRLVGGKQHAYAGIFNGGVRCIGCIPSSGSRLLEASRCPERRPGCHGKALPR